MKEKKNFPDEVRRLVGSRDYNEVHMLKTDAIDACIDFIKKREAKRGYALLDPNEIIEETKPNGQSDVDVNELITRLKNIQNLVSEEGGLWNADEDAKEAIYAISECLSGWLVCLSKFSSEIIKALEKKLGQKVPPEIVWEKELATIFHFTSFALYRREWDLMVMTEKSNEVLEDKAYRIEAPRLTYDSVVNFPYWGKFKPAIETLVNENFSLTSKEVARAFMRVMGIAI